MRPKLDPVLLGVVKSKLAAVAEEMALSRKRAARAPLWPKKGEISPRPRLMFPLTKLFDCA